MSIFGNLSTENHAKVEDRLGGFAVFPTNVYEATIKMAYAGASKGGARFVAFQFDLGGKDYSETIYVTNKDGQNFFYPKDKDGKPDTSKTKQTMPGYVTVDDIALLTTGKPLNEQDAEEKIVKIYDYEQSKEVPTNVPVLVEMLGGKVFLAIQQSNQDKNAKDEATGEYRPTGETRDVNNIEKSFSIEDKRTVVEIREELKDATFHDKWLEKNRDVVRDKTKKGAGAGGSNGRPPQGNGAAPQGDKPKTSLFNKNK